MISLKIREKQETRGRDSVLLFHGAEKVVFAAQKLRTTYSMKEGKRSTSVFTDLNLSSPLSGPSEEREAGLWL